MWRDMRSFMEFLEDRKDLVRIKKEVDLKYEISAVLRKMGKGEMPAAVFERVKNRNIPVVGNLYTTPRRVCQALGVPKDKIWLEYLSTIHDTENPVPGMMQSARAHAHETPYKEIKNGPVKEVIKKGSDVDLTELPIPIWFEHDAGPYITGGVGIAWNTKTEIFNAGIYRTQIIDKDTLAIYPATSLPGSRISPTAKDIYDIYLEAEKKGESFDIAVAIGVPPALYIAATGCGGRAMAEIPEFGITGVLMGEPLEVVRCETLNLMVPANAEIIIEGKVDLNTKIMEGPIEEMAGYYAGSFIPVTKVTAITHRKKPIFHVVLPGHHPGHEATQGICSPGLPQRILTSLQSRFPNVKAATTSIPPPSMMHLILAIDKKHEGEPAEIIKAVFDMEINKQPVSRSVRRVTVVDAWDIDIRDLDEVEWAVNSNLQNESRIIVIPNVKDSSRSRTSNLDGTSVRLGIDATAPLVAKEPDYHYYYPADRKKPKALLIYKKPEDKSKLTPYMSWIPESIKNKHGTVPGMGKIDLKDYFT